MVSTKLTDEEHKSLIDACGIAGQSPSAFIRGLINQAVLNQPFPQGNNTGTATSETVSRDQPEERVEDGDKSKKVDTTFTSVETLMVALENDRKRRAIIKTRNLNHGDMLDGQIVSHCSSCNELH